jgi:hypothetical protein
MLHNGVVFWIFLSCLVGSLFGQHAVDPGQRYHRLICLVHLVGSGKNGDEIRPEYVPSPSAAASAPQAHAAAGSPTAAAYAISSRPGIISWTMTVTDDGKMAIVQMVAVDRNAFTAILADTRSEVKIFEVGVDKRQAIEAALKKYKKDFTLDSLQAVAQ